MFWIIVIIKIVIAVFLIGPVDKVQNAAKPARNNTYTLRILKIYINLHLKPKYLTYQISSKSLQSTYWRPALGQKHWEGGSNLSKLNNAMLYMFPMICWGGQFPRRDEVRKWTPLSIFNCNLRPCSSCIDLCMKVRTGRNKGSGSPESTGLT